MKKVLVFGTFDIFHKGHENFLSQALQHGNELVVVVAKDETVRNVKGSYPRNNEEMRRQVIARSGFAAETVLGNLGDKYLILEIHRPDVVCLGYDQNAFVDGLRGELDKRGLAETEIIRLQSYKPDIYKSSKLIN